MPRPLRRAAVVTERPGSTSACGRGSPARVSGESSVASPASCEPCQRDRPLATTSTRLSSATGTSMLLSATRTLRATCATASRQTRSTAHNGALKRPCAHGKHEPPTPQAAAVVLILFFLANVHRGPSAGGIADASVIGRREWGRADDSRQAAGKWRTLGRVCKNVTKERRIPIEVGRGKARRLAAKVPGAQPGHGSGRASG